jgi:hypothetical protein
MQRKRQRAEKQKQLFTSFVISRQAFGNLVHLIYCHIFTGMSTLLIADNQTLTNYEGQVELANSKHKY